MQNGIALERYFEEPGQASHKHDYLILTTMMLIFGSLFFTTAYTNMMKLELALITVLSYLLWGLWHHSHIHALTWDIVIEYTAFTAFLSTVCILLFIFL